MCHWFVFVVVFQESVVMTLGNKLDNDTLETFTLAEQLSTNLTDLNVRIEGTEQLCVSRVPNYMKPSLRLLIYVCKCMCTEMIHDWELYSVHQDVDPEVVRRNTEVAQGMVTWMRKLDLSPREPIATDESTEAHDGEETHSKSQKTSRNRHMVDTCMQAHAWTCGMHAHTWLQQLRMLVYCYSGEWRLEA